MTEPTTDPAAEPATELLGVELARPGTWRLSTGTLTFTERMLRDAADFYTATGGQPIPIAPGHVDSRFDGEPAFGQVANIRYAEDDRGPVLLGDLVNMARWVAAAAPTRWPHRSVFGWQDLEFEGRTYALALTKLALLGASPPAIPNLRALRDAVAAAAAASGGTWVAASAPDGDPVPDPAEAEPSGPEPSGPADPTEGTGMDQAKIREALGLKPDASDDEVRAALKAAGLSPDPEPQPDPAPQPEPQPGDPAPAEPTSVALPTDVPQPLAAAAAAHGAVVLDKGVWDQAQARMDEGVAAMRKLRNMDRDALLDKAVQEGRIPPVNRDYWAQLWESNPKSTAEVIARLEKNKVPVEASGYMGSLGDEDAPDPYRHLFPPAADSVKGR